MQMNHVFEYSCYLIDDVLSEDSPVHVDPTSNNIATRVALGIYGLLVCLSVINQIAVIIWSIYRLKNDRKRYKC